MLEYPKLILGGWSVVSDMPALELVARRRWITEPASGRPVGFVTRRLVRSRWWFCWLRRPVLHVHEAEDEPLLFTVQRGWGWTRRWQVYDADECQVGTIAGRRIVAISGGTVARIRADPATGEIRFQAPQGAELATLLHADAHAELVYADALKDEPIVKMLVLAAALTRMKDEN